MNNRTKDIFQTVFLAAVMLIMCLWCLFKPADEYSFSERRQLYKFPEFSFSSLISGKFMDGFEDYSLDQFPVRDTFRTIKAVCSSYVFGNLDNNGLYYASGAIGKIEYPVKENEIELGAEKIDRIYNNFLKGKSGGVYLSVIPDKNAFFAKENGRLSIDYESFCDKIKDRFLFAEYVDISDLLTLDDFYATDTHWRQEKITDVADRLAESMGTKLDEDYTVNTLEYRLSGVYLGQSALPVKPDEVKYLTGKSIDGCIVTNGETGKTMSVYDMEKAGGKDAYEMFLSGSVSFITIENPNQSNGKKLVIFRDSFGSSLAPLMISGYESIILVDIRYVSSAVIGNLIDFSDKDVLFLYSTILLNNGSSLK